jgi:two-component system phosphate regulon sensor histidine kinase PhoR
MNPVPTKPEAGSGQLEHDRLTSLINSMTDGVMAVDRFTNIVVYNGAAMNILDLNTSLQGKPLYHVMQLIDQYNQPVDLLTYVRETRVPTSTESYRLKYPDGSTVNLFLSVSPVLRGFGAKRQDGHVVVMRDITKAKSLEEERDEFISVVSHELRTPIAIAEGNISNAIFVAEKSGHYGDADKVQQALKEAHNQVLFLSSMMNDLATLSRAERGKLVADIEPINVHELIEQLMKSYTASAEKKGLVLHSHTDPHLELLSSSQLYVREVLQNFITNAIKYTEKGSVTITAKPSARDKITGVLFSVSDTGIGISRSDQDRIFDKFYRSEDFRTRSNNGTGLGLYVTMKLTRILQADIDVTSELNKGSTFTIFVPNLQKA